MKYSLVTSQDITNITKQKRIVTNTNLGSLLRIKGNDPGSHVPQSMVSSMISEIPIREPSYSYNNDDMTGRSVQTCIPK